MRKAIGVIVILLLITSVVILAFSVNQSASKSDKLKVTASFYPLAEFAQQVGGNEVEVTNIVSSGVEPHDFEPTPQDLVKINQADIFIYNGAGLDPWAQKLAPDLKAKGILVINMSQNFKLKRIVNQRESAKVAADPHIWLDPVFAQKEVRIIRDAFIEKDADHSAKYQVNSKKYIDMLGDLDKKLGQGLTNCRLRIAIVSHAAFGYLGKRYNIEMVPIAISPDEEPSPKQIGRLVELVRRKKIKYIFYETLTSPKTAQTIADETGVKTLTLNPIEGLTADQLKAGQDYISIMEENLRNLQLALECK